MTNKIDPAVHRHFIGVLEEHRKPGETHVELAQRIGVSRQRYYCWRHQGKLPSATALIRIAMNLDVSVDRMLGLD